MVRVPGELIYGNGNRRGTVMPDMIYDSKNPTQAAEIMAGLTITKKGSVKGTVPQDARVVQVCWCLDDIG